MGDLFPLHQVRSKYTVIFAGKTNVEIVLNWINQWIVWAMKQKILLKKLITNRIGARQLND